MKIVTSHVPMLKAVHSLVLPEAGQTEWGVPIMDTDRFQQVTDAVPTYFSGWDNNREVVVDWLDPQTGGVSCMLKSPPEVDERFSRLPYSENRGMASESRHTPGMHPNCYDKEFVSYSATHLGYLVLANTPELVAVQLPGIDDYVSAYKHVNNNEEPGIMPDILTPFHPIGKQFLRLIAQGRWPHDMHFFKVHAPAFVIGGSPLVDELRASAQRVSAPDLSNRVGFIDRYGSSSQVTWATERVKNYHASNDPAALHETDYGDVAEQLPVGHTDNEAVINRFNSYAARTILGVELPLDASK
jgi:hypothetical protein